MRSSGVNSGKSGLRLRSQTGCICGVAALILFFPIACGGSPPKQATKQVTVKVGALTMSASGALMPFGAQDLDCVAVVGNQLQIAACGGAGQSFVINGATIQTNASPPLCLGIQNQDLAAGVATVAACDGSSSQQWSFNGSQIVSMDINDGKFHCLDAQNGNHIFGTPLDVAVCNNTTAQLFWAAGFTMKIASTFSAPTGSPPLMTPECLDVLFDNETVGATLDDSVCNGSNAQWFVLTTVGQITLANNTSLCVRRGTAQNGLAPIALATCNSADPAQKWSLGEALYAGGPVVGIGAGGDCLDIQDGSEASPTTVDVYTCNGTPAQLWQPSLATGAGNRWTKVAMPFPGGIPGPTNVALMTDGTVLASSSNAGWIPSSFPPPLINDQSNYWYSLTPDAQGSYANGTWSPAPSSNLGRMDNESFVLKDGHYLECGGEYVDDRYELAMHDVDQDYWARCEVYDPTSFSWTEIAPFPAYMRDVPGVELPTGDVMALESVAGGSETNILTFDSSGNGTWTPESPYDRVAINTEGDCILQQDGNVFCGIDHFGWFFPDSPINSQWVMGPAKPGPLDPPSIGPLNAPPINDEQGPMLLLYDGSVLVLGSNAADQNRIMSAQSAIFTPQYPWNQIGYTGQWQMAPDLPTNGLLFFDHGDVPAAVMPDGRVLVTSRQFPPNQAESDVLHEYDPSTRTWNLVPPFPGSPGSNPVTLQGEGIRMLMLPTGQVLVTGTSDGSMWLYNPSGTKESSWWPTISTISAPSGGVFTLSGTQLNGLTNGANYGDDAKMTTSYPIVFLTDNAGSGNVYYARTSHFSRMTPSPSAAGTSQTCEFTLPPGIPNGEYTVHVSTSGEQSDPTPVAGVNQLSVSDIHVSAITRSGPLSGTVFLSAQAPAGGQRVNLAHIDANSDVALGIPGSITIPQGATSQTFTLNLIAFGTSVITAETYPANPSFAPATIRMGWAIQSVANPSVIYGDRGALTSVPWTVTFTDPIPGTASVSLLSSNTDVAAVSGSGTFVPPNSMTFNVTKVGSTRGLSTITANVGNSTKTFTFSDRDIDFYKCADEGGTCVTSPSSRKWIAYGANGYYNYLLSSPTTGTIQCNAATFGDPSGATNACYISDYEVFANADGSVTSPFYLNGPADIAFGTYTGYSYNESGPLSAGWHSCDTGIFGPHTDAAPGSTSYCLAGPDPSAYVWRVGEGTTLTVPSSTPIAYGAAGHFVFAIASGTVTCNASTFGDPTPSYPDYPKSCYTLKYHFKVADQGQPLKLPVGTSVLYGSGLNGNFLTGTVSGPTATCSNSYFAPNGGDPDYGEFKYCWILDEEGSTKGDGNGDAVTDIYLVGAAFGNVPVAENLGGGVFDCDAQSIDDTNFTNVWATTPNVKALAGDFNGDGLGDIALTGVGGWGSLPVAFRTSAGFHVTNDTSAGIGNFAGWAGWQNAWPVTGDFNGDGKTDIALVGSPGYTTLPVAFSDGSGSFTVANNPIGSTFYAYAAQEGARPVTGDFNGDGFSDIAIIGGTTSNLIPIAFSNGDGSFTVQSGVVTSGDTNFTTYSTWSGVHAVSGDFDGDGIADIALTGGSGWWTVPVAFSNGDGTFRVTNSGISSGDGGFPTYSSWGAQPVSGDFNNDGKSDIALTGGKNPDGSPWWTIPVAFSNGDGTWNVTNTSTQGANFPAQSTTPGVFAVGGGY